MTWRGARWLPCLLLGAAACRPTSAIVPIESRATWPSPARGEDEPDDQADARPRRGLDPLCLDVGDVRACFEGAPGSPPRLVSRPLPPRAPSTALGWRCVGQGMARVCIDRAREAPPFTCIGALCRQRPPRLPDDGDWSCGDMEGAAVCAGGSIAAGLPSTLAAPGWQCGARRRQDELGAATARICVDLSPDTPDGQALGWRCHYESAPAPVRICERVDGRALLGGPCAARHAPCPLGAACVDGRCLPARPGADCWLDEDCPSRACAFGSCREAPP